MEYPFSPVAMTTDTTAGDLIISGIRASKLADNDLQTFHCADFAENADSTPMFGAMTKAF